MRKNRVARLHRLRETASLSTFIAGLSGPLPKTRAEVTKFIQDETRLYIETWVLPIVDELIAEATQAREKRRARGGRP